MVANHAQVWAPVVRVIKLIALYLGYQLLSYSILYGIYGVLVSSGLYVKSFGHDMTVLSISLVLSEACVIWHLSHFKYASWREVSWSGMKWEVLFVSILMIIGVMNASNILSESLCLPNLMQNQFVEISRNVCGFMAISILGPVAEELTFRVGMEGYFLRRGLSPQKAILLSAAVFGIVHVNPAQVLFAFCLGVVFGWLYYRTGSVLPTIIGHILNNCMAALIMVFSSDENLKKTTVEQFGLPATILFFMVAVGLIVVAYFLLTKRMLPKAPDHSSMGDNR